MSELSIFDISASGMEVEKLRMQIEAINLANVNTTRTKNGGVFKPLSVISSTKYGVDFETLLDTYSSNYKLPTGVQVDDIEELDVRPRIVYEPSHPDADDKGFVRYPNINTVSEMINLINITRSYEANVRTFNAGKRMLQSAMDIGGR